MTLFRYQVYLAGQRPTNWGHHLYGDLSHDRQTHINTDMSPRAYGLTSLSECDAKMMESKKQAARLQSVERVPPG